MGASQDRNWCHLRAQTFLLGSLVLFIALVAPPLLLIGTPPWMFRPLLRLPLALPIGRWLTSALVFLLVLMIVWFRWLGRDDYEQSRDVRPVLR